MNLPEPLQQVDRTWVNWRGQTLAYFAGCDYFRMASHPEVLNAAEEALRKYGLNVAASRWTTGNHELYDWLEAALRDFFQARASLLISNGFLTNIAVAHGLAGKISHVLIDERAHRSLFEASRAAMAPVILFAHRNTADLAMKISHRSAPVVMTDGVFAHDGSIAPLGEYQALLPGNAYLLVDDSHAAGVLGKHGRGTPEHCGVSFDGLVQTITLSKAFGSYGGAILAAPGICEAITDASSIVAGATPFPLPCAAAALAAIRLLGEPGPRERLWENLSRVPGKHEFPILSIMLGDATERDRLKRALLARGIFPPQIRYGDGGEDYFRFAISSEHTRAQLDALALAIAEGA